MNIHEYQAKALFEKFGVPVPKGATATSPEEFITALAQLPEGPTMVKSQIHAGGRGKGTFTNGYKGGVKFCKTKADAREVAGHMLGNVLVTAQTGPAGRQVQTIYFTVASDIKKEYYLAILLDRASSRPAIIASTEGGVEIEKVAHDSPERIFKVLVDPAYGLADFQVRELVFRLGLAAAEAKNAARLIRALYAMYWETDAAMVEINPMITTPAGDVLALDAKVSFDDNALFRRPEIVALRDLNEEDSKEIEASKHGLNYIALDGSIACLVNGAGLAMSTMDIIKHFGGSPANFLDVGGGASKDQVIAAFKIILGDPAVKGIFVNIFGGIMDCNVIATGIVEAVKEVGLKLPLVVRLEGNNVAAGKATLAGSGLTIVSGDSMADAAQKIVKLVALITMAILVTPTTKLIVQGITGDFGARHARLSLDYGTQVVAGVTPGKGGQFFEHGKARVPIFNSVADAKAATGATVSVVFVPPPFAADAILEGADARLDLVIAITEGIPIRDMIRVKRAMAGGSTRLIGPNCPGIVTPGTGEGSTGGCRIGIAPGYIHRKGHVGVVSRSGTLTYEAVYQLTVRQVGQSTSVGIGGDPVNGTSHLDVVKMFNADPDTHGIIVIGEIGGNAEVEAARWIKANCKKPVAGFIAGATAPAGRRMGHAGAIVGGTEDTAAAKIAVFQECGIEVAATPSDMADALIRSAKAKGVTLS